MGARALRRCTRGAQIDRYDGAEGDPSADGWLCRACRCGLFWTRQRSISDRCGVTFGDRSDPPTLLFHYTSGVVLKGIVETKVLWGTDVEFLNDWQELRFGREELCQSSLCQSRFDLPPISAAKPLRRRRTGSGDLGLRQLSDR